MLGNYRVASQLVASRVVLSSIELASHPPVLYLEALLPNMDFCNKIKLN
jgi:hypothetical protein